MSEPIVSSLAKALRVLECFTVSEPELGVTEISKKLGIGKSNAHNIISTYCQMGYLQQLPNRKYTLGYKLLEHISAIRTRCTISCLRPPSAPGRSSTSASRTKRTFCICMSPIRSRG